MNNGTPTHVEWHNTKKTGKKWHWPFRVGWRPANNGTPTHVEGHNTKTRTQVALAIPRGLAPREQRDAYPRRRGKPQDARQRPQSAPPRLCDAETKKHNTKVRRPRKGALALLSKGRQTELKAVMAATYYRHGVTRIPLAQMGSIDVLTAHPTTTPVFEEMWMNEFASLNRGSDVARLQDKNLAVEDFESKVGGLLRNALGSILDDFWLQAWRRERRAFPSHRTRAEIPTVEPRPKRTPVAPTPHVE